MTTTADYGTHRRIATTLLEAAVDQLAKAKAATGQLTLLVLTYALLEHDANATDLILDDTFTLRPEITGYITHSVDGPVICQLPAGLEYLRVKSHTLEPSSAAPDWRRHAVVLPIAPGFALSLDSILKEA